MVRRGGRLGLAALALLLAAAPGCRRERGEARRETLTLAVRSDVTGVFPNPPAVSEAFTIDVAANVFDALVRFDRNLRPQPALAESWQNPDERTWVFRLRPDARFSDGSPVLASDVAASLRAVGERGFLTSFLLQDVEDVEADGASVVRIRTEHPSPLLLSQLTFGFVLPASALARSPVPPVGSGPYAVERWTPGEGLDLVRNPHASPRPPFDRVRFVVTPDARGRAEALLSGRADVADDLPPAELDRLRADGRFRVESRPGLRVLFLAMRTNTGPFADPRVREAVELAIDRDELVARALAGRAVPATQLVPPMVMGFNPSIVPPRTDRERARELLRQAGHGQGLSVRLDGTTDRYVNDAEVLREVARQLGLAGIRVRVNALPKREFFPLVDSQGSSLYLMGFSCDTVHAGMALESLLHTPDGRGFGRQNTQGLSDPELDRLVEAAHAARDLPVRARLLSEALARVAEVRPVVPLHLQLETLAWSRRLDWEPPPNLTLRLHDVRLVTRER